MTRLYIVDQSGLELGGHYHAYTGCVAEGARQVGLDTVVLANKRLRAKTGGDLPPDIGPCFTYTWGEAELHGSTGWEEGNIACEMFEAFRRVPPTDGDHVFLHTTGYRELRALLDSLTGKLPGEPLPYFHLLLRRDPDILVDNYRDYADYFARIAASPYLRSKILLHTDTHLLSQAFADLCRVPFATAPIPFDQTALCRSLAARKKRRARDPLTVVYLGDAREEKGYQHLPQALSYLWKNYVEPGRVRFVLQSNFNTPGGEPGILAASQNLAGFLHTTLKTAPLQPDEYYEILADSDIVLIPYSAQRYRYRSSGVLVEAMGAGKVVVTSARSWMATQVTPEHAVLFETPAGLGPAIAEAIDRFDELRQGAEARREATLERATGASLARHLLATAQPPASRASRNGRRVLLVMNGDAMALDNGASRIAHAQLQYLVAAGYDVVGLFLTYHPPETGEAFFLWRTALARSIAPFPLERVFVAGPSSFNVDPDQSPAVRGQRQMSGAALKAEFEFTAGFEFGGKLLQFLRTHPVDAVLLNYVTAFPVAEALGLEGVPVICEMHDLQSFQRAIYGQRLVDKADLDEEFAWLKRCAALVSLNARETAIVRERLPGAVIETTGVFLPTPPPALRSLAGAKDLAEVVSSSRPLLPQYRFEVAWDIGRPEEVQRLIEAGTADLLYVSSAHMANVSGLRWFLSEVYEPYLAHRRVSMIVAGSISRIEGWPRHPLLFFIDQVEDLAPLYAAAQVVVLPITEGAGGPVKTYEALAYGRPVVGTSHAFRGVDGDPGEFIIRDEPQEFAAAILDLIGSEGERKEAAGRSRRAAARLNDYGRYFRVMDRIFAEVLPGKRKPTPSPKAREQPQPYVEWPFPIQAVNRLLRSCLDGEPLEAWALDLLAGEREEDVESLLDGVSRSLLEERDAAVLRSEQRLQCYLANPLGAQLREDAVFAVKLALAGRRGVAIEPTNRVVAYGGLPLTIAGVATPVDDGEWPLQVDSRPIPARRMAGDMQRLVEGGSVFQAELPALEGGRTSLRTLEIETEGRIAVLRQSVRIAPSLRLLDRDVFGGGFELRGDGSSADLAPGGSGELILPRLADGRSPGYVDLCFARFEQGEAFETRTGSLVSVTANNQPAETEFVERGAVLLVRVFLDVHGDAGAFGAVAVTVANRDRFSALRLLAVHSGLLVGPMDEAGAIATALALAGQRSEAINPSRRGSLAREAILKIAAGVPPRAAALEAVSNLSSGAAGHDALRALAAQVLTRGARSNGASRGEDEIVDDLLALLGDSPGAALLSPAMPFEIVDRSDNEVPARTEAALQERGSSWRLPIPADGADQRVRVRLDATLEIPGRRGLIECAGFHPLENASDGHRWTGPELTARIVIPLMLNRPALLAIELGATGRNREAGDFGIAVNGVPVPHRFEAGDGSAMLRAELPAGRSARPTTEIALTVRECFQQPPDERVLGVVFRSLTLILDGQSQMAERAPAVAPAAGRRRSRAADIAVDGA
jgi:glycosyltransferase involved in cell wall biosynthesis